MASILTASALGGALAMAQVKGKGDPTLVYIGTYTGEKAKGIYLFRLQPEGDEVFQNVTLVPLGLVAELPNPTFIELDVKRRRLFAVSEVESFEGKPTGGVSAYSIDPAGKLTLVNRQSSMGARPCHLALDRDGTNLLVTNCGASVVAVLPVAADGRLGDATDVVPGTGKSVTLDPGGRFAFTADPARDTLQVFRFDAQRGTLTPHNGGAPTIKAGTGPRQIRFAADGRFAYLVNEKSSTITVFAYDPASGALKDVQSVSTVPEYFDGPNTAGELYIHRSGKWLYASNSGHNSVVLFTIDKEKGTLSFVEEQGTGGKNPRFFGVEPSAKHLAISNVDSDTVLASRIDEGNGRLKPSGIFASLPAPAGVRFLPPVGQVSDK